MKRIILALIVIAAFLLLSYRILDVPPGINGDEVGIAYNAMLISRTLKDESGMVLPLFIKPSTSDWKQPVTVYATAILFFVFGPSFFWLRAVSIIFACLSIIIFYWISEEYTTKHFLAFVLIFVTTPIIVIQSHLALENIAPLPFILLWILMIQKFTKNNKPKYLIIAGVALGISLFSYYGMRIVVPVLAALTMFYLSGFRFRISRGLTRQAMYFGIGLIPFAALLYFSKFFYPGAVLGEYRAPLLVPPLEFMRRYLSYFDLTFLFFKGDVTPYHSTGAFGMLLVASLPLFIVGLVNIMRGQDSFKKLLLISFFAVPMLYGFVPEIYRASRILSIVPFYTLVSGFGLIEIWSTKMIGRFVGTLFILVISANYITFMNDYWYYYPDRVATVFSTPMHKAFEAVDSKLRDKNYKVYIDGNILGEPTSFKFFKEVYLPTTEIIVWNKEPIDAPSIIIANPDVLKDNQENNLVPITDTMRYYKVFIKE